MDALSVQRPVRRRTSLLVLVASAPKTPVKRANTWCMYDASGTSAVAIDNKIEQAMDLVKSHLMFAVREEVEVLREKIAELMDRINLLELENSVLKSHATPDTLASLPAPQPQPQPQPQTTLPPAS